jgi:hypothetical protein
MKIKLSVVILALSLGLGLGPGQAAPAITKVVPADGTSGVGTTTAIVFTFSESMNPDATSVNFMDITSFPPAMFTTDDTWSAGNTVLTCSPIEPWPANKRVQWFVSGENENGDPLAETPLPMGAFTTGSGSGGGETGSGTNQMTGFSVGKIHNYDQTNAGPATLDPDTPYGFIATVTLASNRTATAISLKLPTGETGPMSRNMFSPEHFTKFDFTTNRTALDSQYPPGNYVFDLQSSTSPLQVTVNLPTEAAMPQPEAPHVKNFAEVQAVNPSQAFTLTWDPFKNATKNDYIFVDIGSEFQTGLIGETNALPGTATSITIPANVFKANSNYDGWIGFYRFVASTNQAGNYGAEAFRATATYFSLVTTSGGGPVTPPALGGVSWNGGKFEFNVSCTGGQPIIVESSTSLLPNSWQVVTATNCTGTGVKISLPTGTAPGGTFFRVRSGG